MVDDLKDKELVVISVAASNKVKACIASVDKLVLLPFDKVTELGGTADYYSLDIFHHANTVLFADLCGVELGEPGFALSVKKDKSVDHLFYFKDFFFCVCVCGVACVNALFFVLFFFLCVFL